MRTSKDKLNTSLKKEIYTLPASSISNMVCKIISPLLNVGNYYINIGIVNKDEQFEDRIQSVAEFSITTGSFDNRVATNSFPVLAKFEWKFE